MVNVSRRCPWAGSVSRLKAAKVRRGRSSNSPGGSRYTCTTSAASIEPPLPTHKVSSTEPSAAIESGLIVAAISVKEKLQ